MSRKLRKAIFLKQQGFSDSFISDFPHKNEMIDPKDSIEISLLAKEVGSVFKYSHYIIG